MRSTKAGQDSSPDDRNAPPNGGCFSMMSMAPPVKSLIESEKILYLSRSDVESCLDGRWDEVIAAITDAYKILFAGDASLPKSEYLKYRGRPSYDRIISLLGYLGGQFDVSGLKQICSSTSNLGRGMARASGVLILNDPYSNRPYCILESATISAMRTAGVTGLAMKSLQGTGSYRTVAMLGCGRLAAMHLEMLAHLLCPKDTQIRVFDPHEARLSGFVDRAREKGFKVVASVSAPDAMHGADLITPMTTAEEPHVEASHLGQAWTYCAVSLLDAGLDLYEAADLIVVDDLRQCLAEGRPLERLAGAGMLPKNKIVEIGDWISSGRERREARVLFNPMGTVITDIAVAAIAFSYAEARDLGVRLPV